MDPASPVAIMEDLQDRQLGHEVPRGDIIPSTVDSIAADSNSRAEISAAQSNDHVGGQAHDTIWTPPTYAFGSMMLGAKVMAPPAKRGKLARNFHRSASWCFDGSAVLALGEDQVARVYHTQALRAAAPPVQSPILSLTLPAPALSSAWFPSASISNPAANCFALGIRDAPVRLVDATTGVTRATYPIVDHRERYVAPWSMAWNPASTRLYCGHDNAIEVLDVSSPGHGNGERIKTSRTKGDRGGQKGIVSVIAFAKDQSGVYAAGTYGSSRTDSQGESGGSVSLYDEDASGAVGHLGGIAGGGVTQIAFHPLSACHLFVASRRSSYIQAYDTRNPTEPFHTFDRNSTSASGTVSDLSNQRMYFDIDPWGRYLAAGSAVGGVKAWSIGQDWADLLWDEQVGKDAVSSVQFSSTAPELLVSVGSRDGSARVRTNGSGALASSDSSDSDDDEYSSDDDPVSGTTDRSGDGYLSIITFTDTTGADPPRI